MQKRFEIMLAMQDSMNRKVHPDWQAQGFAWHRATWIECGELMEHYGYKWWKKQTPDMAQVQLEVIDIWHFGMSALFDGRSIPVIAESMVAALEDAAPVPECELREAVEAVAEHALRTRSFSVPAFWSLLTAAGMDADDLYGGYVGKNVLNVFRQDHGYQEGTYRKSWDGREDNEHLVELVAELDLDAPDFRDALYRALSERYAAVAA